MNKPVAYIDPYDLERLPHYDCHIGSQQLKKGIPLYTHPHSEESVKVKELTDAEIIELWKQFENNETPIRNFAKAILRKAQK